MLISKNLGVLVIIIGSDSCWEFVSLIHFLACVIENS